MRKEVFVAVLRKYGFKKMRVAGGNYYMNESKNWEAQILDHGAWYQVWMSGAGLEDDDGFPGGHIYETATELEKELSKASAPC